MAEESKRKYLAFALGKIKLHNAGEKVTKHDRPMAFKEPSVYYPSLHLNVKQVPELKGYDVKDKCILVVKGELTGHHANEHRGREDSETFDIEIREIGVQKKK